MERVRRDEGRMGLIRGGAGLLLMAPKSLETGDGDGDGDGSDSAIASPQSQDGQCRDD